MKNLQVLTVAAIVVMGMALSTMAAFTLYQSDRKAEILRFEREADNSVSGAIRELENLRFMTDVIRTFFKSSDYVSKQEFDLFLDTLLADSIAEQDIGSVAKNFGWADWVPGGTGRVFIRDRSGAVTETTLSTDGVEELWRAFEFHTATEPSLLFKSVTDQQWFDENTPYVTIVAPNTHKPFKNSVNPRHAGARMVQGFAFVTIDVSALYHRIARYSARALLKKMTAVNDGLKIPVWSGLAERIGRGQQLVLSGREAERHFTYLDVPVSLNFEEVKSRLFLSVGVKALIVLAIGVIATLCAATYIVMILRQQATLHKAHMVAEHTNEQKSRFLANMSHEIRTPLSAVVGMARLLRKTDLNEKQTAFAQNLQQSAESLLNIISDILDLSKLENGSMTLVADHTDVKEVVGDTARQFAPLAREKGLKLLLNYPPEVHRYAVVDGLRLRQVLSNLIGNALKFTNSGRVSIRVTETRDASDADVVWLAFTVEDTGVGIGEDKLETIFERFTQADATTTKKFGGTGLGLAISKELVDLMGGRIEAANVPGGGAKVTFSVPAVPSTEKQLATKSDATPEANQEAKRELPVNPGEFAGLGSGLKVLLVEDDRVNQLYATELLSGMGCTVTTAIDGAEGVAAAKRDRFDIILMDCQMPVMDGFEASRRITDLIQYGTIPAVPIVALTANALRGDREKCLNAGMTDYLAKPLDEQKLVDVINRVARNPLIDQPNRQAVGSAPSVEAVVPRPVVPANEPGAPVIPQPALGQAARAETPVFATQSGPAMPAKAAPALAEGVIDKDIYEKSKSRLGGSFGNVVSFYVDDTAGYLESIEKSLRNGRPEEVIRPAHTLKSSSLLLGATKVSKTAKELEALASSARDGEVDLVALNAKAEQLKEAFSATRPHLELYG